LNINEKIIKIYKYSFLIVIWSFLCTSIFNNQLDFTYVKHTYTITIMLLSCYACTYLIKRTFNKLDFEIVTKFYFVCLLIQSLVAIVIFVNPSFASFIMQIQSLGEREQDIFRVQLDEQTRFFGFGLLFYTASFFYGAGLIFLSYTIRYLNIYNKVLLIIFYIFLAIVGMALSRSTIIGIVLSLLILIFPINVTQGLTKKIFKSIIFIGIVAFISVLITFLNFDFVDKYSSLIDNVFDFVLVLFETGSLESNSAKGTFDMYVLPKEEYTYFFGTGIYEFYSSIQDFNYSDIGYLRLLYYSGILGLILFIIFELKVLKYAFHDNNLKIIYFAMVALLLITNVKGLTTLAVIAMMYLNISEIKLQSKLSSK